VARNLQQQYEAVQKNLQAFLATPGLHGSNELGSWVSYLSQVENYLAPYRTMALYLKGLGFDELFKQVERVLADVHKAGETYAEKYKTAFQSEADRTDVAQAASKQWFDTMQEVMKARQAAFDAAQAQWEAAFRRD
jgi:hypothetical protein